MWVCQLLRFSCSPTSTTQINTTKLVLQQKIYDETSARKHIESWTCLNLVPIIGSACLLISELDTQALLVVFTVACGAIVNFFMTYSNHLYGCVFYDVCSLILNGPHIHQSNLGVQLRKPTTQDTSTLLVLITMCYLKHTQL